MAHAKAITKVNDIQAQNVYSHKMPSFSAAAIKRAKNAKASARLLAAMKFVKTEASPA